MAVKIKNNITNLNIDNLIKTSGFESESPDFKTFLNLLNIRLAEENRNIVMKHYSPDSLLMKLLYGTAALIVIAAVTFSLYITRIGIKAPVIAKQGTFLVTSIQGTVESMSPGKEWKNVSIGDQLQQGDIIETGVDSACGFQLKGRIVFNLSGFSRIKISHSFDLTDRLDAEIDLTGGEMFLKSGKLMKNDSLAIQTSNVITSVSGAPFCIGINATGASEIGVIEGNVNISSVSNKKILYEVNPGQEYDADIGVKKSLTGDLRNNLEQLSNSIIAAGGREGGTVNLNFNTDPAGAIVTINGKYIGTTPCEQSINKSGGTELGVSLEGYSSINEKLSIYTNFQDVFFKMQKVATGNSLQSENEKGGLIWSKIMPAFSGSSINPVPDGLLVADKQGLGFISSDSRTWQSKNISFPDDIMRGEAVFCSNFVIIPVTGGFSCYNDAGRLLWATRSAGIKSPDTKIAALYGLIAYASIDKGLSVYDNNGDLVKNFELPDTAVYSTPLFLDNGRIIVFGTEDGFITAYNLENKTQIFRINPYNDRILYTLVGDSRGIFSVSRSSGTAVLIDPADGEIKWRTVIPGARETVIDPFIAGDFIYIVSMGNQSYNIYKLDISSGNVSGEKHFSGSLLSWCNSETGLFMVSSEKKSSGISTISSIDMDSLSVTWSSRMELSSTPEIAAGSSGVYIVSADNINRIRE